MDERNRKEYSGYGAEYEVTREEISKLKEEIAKPFDENARIVSEIQKPADEFSEESEHSKSPSNSSEKKKKNLFKQLAMSIATVGVFATLVFTPKPDDSEEIIYYQKEIEYYPELVPYLTELQEYIEEGDNEAWTKFFQDNYNFFYNQKYNEEGILVFDGKNCYSLTQDSDFKGMIVRFGPIYSKDIYVDVCIGDFTNNVINGEMLCAEISAYNRALPGYARYRYTQWDNSNLLEDIYVIQSEASFYAHYMYGTVNPEGRLVETVTFQNEDLINNDIMSQSCNFDKDGKLVLDDLIYDIRNTDIRYLGESRKEGDITYYKNNAGEWVPLNNDGKIVLYCFDRGEDTNIALLTSYNLEADSIEEPFCPIVTFELLLASEYFNGY